MAQALLHLFHVKHAPLLSQKISRKPKETSRFQNSVDRLAARA
jgi:hypothetical protein